MWNVPGEHCPSFSQRLADVDFLLANISQTDRLAWIAAAKGFGQGSWEPLILSEDAPRIASNMVGNDDCQNVSSGAKIAQYTMQLIEKYRDVAGDGVVCDWDPVQQVYSCPPITVGGGGGTVGPGGSGTGGGTTPTPTGAGIGSGLGSYLPILLVVGVAALAAGGKRRR